MSCLMSCLRRILLVTCVLHLSCVSARGALPLVWTALGPGGQAIVRVVSTAAACPALQVNAERFPLRIRVQPSRPDFPVLVCEAALPPDAVSVTFNGRRLPLLSRAPEKIVVLGDTGCRMKNTLVQACHDPNAWPFARIARSAAAWQPDLVIHVGDYFYRDSPCPTGNPACTGSPWGDTWAAAEADFFAPAEPLLKAAPWIFVRGNHEACQRTGNAWFRLLDPRPLPKECTDETEPYVVPIGDRDVFVLDTTTAHDIRSAPETVAHFAHQFAALAEQISNLGHNPAWLLSHKPLWAFGSRGQPPGRNTLFRTNPTLQAAVQQRFPQGIELVLSGHIHTLEFLAFAQGKPHQFVVGNGGALLDPPLATELVGLDIDDRTVSHAEILTGFGYVTLEQGKAGWKVTPRDAAGLPRPCRFRSPGVSCAPQD